MYKNYINKRHIIILFLCSHIISACSTYKHQDERKKRYAENKTPTLDLSAATPTKIIQHGNFTNNNPMIAMSDYDNYRVSLYTKKHPIPLYKIHNWFVYIETANSKPVENAKIYIHGGMPAHRHGLPTTPRVKKYLGNGTYQIEGVKFSMIGKWELRINIKETDRRDRAVFNVVLSN